MPGVNVAFQLLKRFLSGRYELWSSGLTRLEIVVRANTLYSRKCVCLDKLFRIGQPSRCNDICGGMFTTGLDSQSVSRHSIEQQLDGNCVGEFIDKADRIQQIRWRFSICFGDLTNDRLAIDRIRCFDRNGPISKEIGIRVE